MAWKRSEKEDKRLVNVEGSWEGHILVALVVQKMLAVVLLIVF